MSKTSRHSLPYWVSQNFLTSSATIRRLIRLAGLSGGDTVLEIGAGKGHITRCLAETCRRVISYEIDGSLYGRLKPVLPDNVRLIHGDFLKASLPKTPYQVFANIPFSATTAIVRKLTGSPHPPESLWLIMEKGAAKRFCGLPRESRDSLLLKPWFDARIVWHFRREDFHPVPGVDVVMLCLRQKTHPDVPPALRAKFAHFLARGPELLTRGQVSAALKRQGLPPLKTSGDILYVQWLCLFRCWLSCR